MITAEVIEGVSRTLLAARYDDPKPIPAFHREMWELCCSDADKIAIAAPRGHAKSTAVTFAYVLTALMFRQAKHVLVLSANEELAAGFVNDIRVELLENEALREAFGFEKFTKDADHEIIGQFRDKSRFRVIAKGAGQRMRGIKWERKRPDLVVSDDLEDDEIVLNQSRREKFKRWFYGAVVPIIKDGGKIRMVGTIVHMDSLLENMMPDAKDPETVVTPLKVWSTKDKAWVSVKYRAHDETFEHILWPEQFSAEKLKAVRADFAERGILDVYGQEYLNDPIDMTTAYFRGSDFLESREGPYRYYAGIDFAISQRERADFTVIVVVGVSPDGFLNVLDVRRGRWDGKEILDEMFAVQQRYSPDLFIAESGSIQKALEPSLYAQMARTGAYINLHPMTPTKDKESRARGIQARMRAGAVGFDKEAEWYPDLHEEMRRFPKGSHDDQVDALAWIGLALNEVIEPTEEDWEDEDMYEFEGANATTGY